MKKYFITLLTLFTINITHAIDINIPGIDKTFTPFEDFNPGDILKSAGRLTDKTINALKEKIGEATETIQFWKEKVKKEEKSVPVDTPYNYDELLSVDNQKIFTQITGKANRISVGKNSEKMSVWMIGIDGIPYEYNPSNKVHNLSWIRQRKNSGVTKIAVAEDGTIAGIDQNGNVVKTKILTNKQKTNQHEKWEKTTKTIDGRMMKLSPKGWENLKAIDLDIANNKKLVYLSKDRRIFKYDNNDWKTLPQLKNKNKFQSVSIGADGTIVACTDKFTAHYFDGQNWIALPGKVKKIAVGSKTNLVGISDKDELIIFDTNKNFWVIQKNLVSTANHKNKPIKVIDVATNSSGNIWAIQPDKTIITNIAANTNEALQKLKPEKVVTINSLSEDKLLRVETKEGNYLKPTGTNPEDKKTQFTIIRSGQYFGLQQNNKFVMCNPNEGLGEFKGSIKLSPNFLSGEKWLFSGELEQVTITSYANKRNLAIVPLEKIVVSLKEEQMKWIQKHHDSWQAGAITGAITTGYVAGLTSVILGPFSLIVFAGWAAASLVAITAIEFQRQRTTAELEDYTNPVLSNPGLLGPMIPMSYIPTIVEENSNEEEELLPSLFDIEIQKGKQKEALSTEEKDFKTDYQFKNTGQGYIKLKVSGNPLNFWLWDQNKKEIIMPGVIGGQNNTTISIGTANGWQPIAKKDEIVKPNIANSFWIEIKNNKLTIGAGDLIGINKLGESEKINDLSKVKYVTFSKLPNSDVNISELRFYSHLLGEEKQKVIMDKIRKKTKNIKNKTKEKLIKVKNKIKPKKTKKLISKSTTKEKKTITPKPQKVIVDKKEEEAYGGI